MTLMKAVMILSAVEMAVIGVLIVWPFLTQDAVEVWQIALCVFLLTATSAGVVALSFVRKDGKWQQRWGAQSDDED